MNPLSSARRRGVYPTLIGVVVGMLIAGTAIPLFHGNGVEVSAGVAQGAGSTGPGLGLGPGAAATGSGGVPLTLGTTGGTSANGSTTGVGSAPGGISSGSVGTGGGAGSSGTGGSVTAGSPTGGAAASSGTGGSVTAGSPTGGGAGPNGTAGSVTTGSGTGGSTGSKLTATDVGVSASTVKVGFLILDVGGLGSLGASVGVDDTQEQAAYQSYVDDINARGGIDGRKIVPYYVKYNVLSTSTGNQGQYTGPEACRTLTEQDQVFGVVGFLDPTDTLCVTQTNRTVMMNTSPDNTTAMFQQSSGRLLALFPRSDRMMVDWVAMLDRAGFLAGKKIGILDGATFDPGYVVAQNLAAVLKQDGHTVTRISELSGDVAESSSQASLEASQQAAAGTQVMLILTAITTAQTFAQDAQNQGDKFAYAVSDFASDGGDPVSQMPQSFDGALGVTSPDLGGHVDHSGWSPSPTATMCSQVYQKHTGQATPAYGTNAYALTMQICDSTYFFAKVAAAAGDDLTRASMAAATARVGSFPSGYMYAGSFAAGKPDYSDYFRLERYDHTCNCWRPDGGWTKGAS